MILEICGWERPEASRNRSLGGHDELLQTCRRREDQQLGSALPRGGDAHSHVFGYCLSHIIVARYALPSALVPLMVLVIVLPSFETTLRPVTLYFPSFFFAL
jgi:hypothetical protein